MACRAPVRWLKCTSFDYYGIGSRSVNPHNSKLFLYFNASYKQQTNFLFTQKYIAFIQQIEKFIYNNFET